MDYFKKYLIVGGMPQVVQTFIDSNYDFTLVDKVKRDILDFYRSDMHKRGLSYGLKAESIFDEIPDQLQKHDKKFRITSLDKEAKTRTYEDAFLWLKDAKIANIAFNATEPSVEHNICLIEVKSSKNYTITSLNKFIDKYTKLF